MGASVTDLLRESKDICHLMDTQWNGPTRMQAISLATNQKGESILTKRKWNKLSGKEEVTRKYNV